MRPWAGLLVGTLLLAAQPQVQPRLTKADGERFQTKLTRIVTIGNTPRSAKRAAESTTVSDVEVNSYLRYHAQE